jgi:hypothetical protein
LPGVAGIVAATINSPLGGDLEVTCVRTHHHHHDDVSIQGVHNNSVQLREAARKQQKLDDKSRQNTRAMAFERELAEKISRLATSYKEDEALWFQLKIICFCFSAAPALLHLSTTRIMT